MGGGGGWARETETVKRNAHWHCVLAFPSRVLRAGPSSLSPGSLLQALEMQSTLGLGVAAMQGAPCRFFPNRSCLILRNQVRAHALHLHIDASQPGTVGSAKCESPPALRSLADPPSQQRIEHHRQQDIYPVYTQSVDSSNAAVFSSARRDWVVNDLPAAT